MIVYVNGQELPEAEIDAWELGRARVVARFLKSEFGLSLPPGILEGGAGGDTAAIRGALMRAKLGVDPARIRSRMRLRLALSRFLLKIINFLSLGHRKTAALEIVAEGASAEEIVAGIETLFLTNSPGNRELNLLGSPDHYVLEAHDGRIQEIVETTGGAPMQSRVFVSYDPRSATQPLNDSGYTLEMAGVVRDAGGTAVGVIRHEYRNEENGFRARIADQFPALFPKSMIRAQQLHMAREFGIWYQAVIDRVQASGQDRDRDAAGEVQDPGAPT